MYSWLSKEVAMFAHLNYPEHFEKRNNRRIEWDE